VKLGGCGWWRPPAREMSVGTVADPEYLSIRNFWQVPPACLYKPGRDVTGCVQRVYQSANDYANVNLSRRGNWGGHAYGTGPGLAFALWLENCRGRNSNALLFDIWVRYMLGSTLLAFAPGCNRCTLIVARACLRSVAAWSRET
jgi:hypothetical protein